MKSLECQERIYRDKYIYIMSFASMKLVQSLAVSLERMVWSYALIEVCALL